MDSSFRSPALRFHRLSVVRKEECLAGKEHSRCVLLSLSFLNASRVEFSQQRHAAAESFQSQLSFTHPRPSEFPYLFLAV